MTLSSEAIAEAQKWKHKEEQNKGKATISYDIRISDDDMFWI